MGIATLKISNGIKTVDLLNLQGIHLSDDGWTPKVIQKKAVYNDNPLAEGRRLVYRNWQTANEVINLTITDLTQDQVIDRTADLIYLLEQSELYWTTEWQDTPVYLISQASCETNPRYALIHSYSVPELDDPYSQPFVMVNGAIFDDIALTIERGHWLSLPPGESDCVEISAVENDWAYDAILSTVDSNPTLVYQFLEAANGDIFSACRNNANTLFEIRVSTDDGLTWANRFNGANINSCYGSFRDSNDNLYFSATTNVMYRSTDDGANWAAVIGNTTAFEIVETVNGYLFTGNVGSISRSTDNGANWSDVYTSTFGGYFTAFNKFPGGTLIATNTRDVGNMTIYRSTDNGVNWSAVAVFGSNLRAFRSLVIGNTMYLFNTNFLGGSDIDNYYYTVLQSTDDGLTWSILAASNIFYQLNSIIKSQSNDTLWYAFLARSNEFYACRTYDSGFVWQQLFDTGVAPGAINQYGAVFETSSGVILSGGVDTLRFNLADTADMGQEATCDNEVFVTNKQNIANLTDIKIDDGGVFTDIFPATLPQILLPAVPALNDAVYFGINTSVLDSGPFSGLVFDLSTGAISTTSYTIVWEYWNGAWVTLTTQDNTAQLSNLNVHSVNWSVPSDWTTTAIDSVTAYWVRAKVSALTGTLTPPVQANRDIYTLNLATVGIVATQVKGDIPALAQIKAYNQSDKDGPGGSAPNLYDNRLIVGLRNTQRGTNFQAFINVSDEQNPAGVTISVGTNTTIGTDVQAPTGRKATYNPGGVEAMATRVTISLSTAIARDYYGKYHAFVRAQRDAGSSTDLSVRLQIIGGSGGVTFNTQPKQLETTTKFEVLDFGQIALPPSGSLKLSEIGDITAINIQASAASGTPNLDLFDLILIPVDEWATDSIDMANESDSEVGRSGGIAKHLNIDSLTKPNQPIRSLVQQSGSNFITAIYNPINNGQVQLENNLEQKLWFFAMQTSATGTSYSWIAPPEISHTVQVYKNQRYLGLRGTQ